MNTVAILDDQTRWNERVIAEGEACDCKNVKVVARVGGGLDDHSVDYVLCRRCGAGEVITTWASRKECDRRPMSAKEHERYTNTRTL